MTYHTKRCRVINVLKTVRFLAHPVHVVNESKKSHGTHGLPPDMLDIVARICASRLCTYIHTTYPSSTVKINMLKIPTTRTI